MEQLKIAFIGGGNMATCIFNGIVATRPNLDKIMVSGPHTEKLAHFAQKGAAITSDNVEALKFADVVFLGVKPQIMPSVLEELNQSGVSLDDKLLVSMAAGFRFEAFYKRLGQCKLIRIMPNTPAQLGLGLTSMCCGVGVSKEQETLCLELLKGLGKTVVTDEEGINSLGALAGSAPAFFYRFMEALVAETIKYGFEPQEARKIIESVALGSAQMVIHNQDKEIGALREAVTSKGGTTFQGLSKMTEYKFEEMMDEVIKACLKRTHEFEEMFKQQK